MCVCVSFVCVTMRAALSPANREVTEEQLEEILDNPDTNIFTQDVSFLCCSVVECKTSLLYVYAPFLL